MDSHGFDWTPLVDSLMSLIGAIFSALIFWIGWYLKNMIAQRIEMDKAKLNEQRQQTYDYAAARSMAHAEQTIGAPNKGSAPGIAHPFVKDATDYLTKQWPDLVNDLDLTPQKVSETILARMSKGAMTETADAISKAKAGTPTKPE